MSFALLRRRVWLWSSLAVFLSACGIAERLVDERSGAGGACAVLGTSTGCGGGGPLQAGASSGGGLAKGGGGGKPDLNAPDPLFPPFKDGGVCAPATNGVPSSTTGAGGESGAGTAGGNGGAAGDTGVGGCARSSCESTRIAQIGDVGAVVADAGEVFFVERGKALGYVFEATIEDGAHILTRLDSLATDLAVDSHWVYIQTDTAIQKIAREGGELQTLASDQRPRGLAVDSSYLYFLSAGNSQPTVRRLSLATGAGETLAALPSTPMRIALDDDNVYVLGKFELIQLPKCRSAQTVLSVASGLGGGLAVDAGYAYWSELDVISRVSKDSRAVEAVIEASPLEGEFIVDGSFAYWGDPSGQVLRAPAGGGPPEVIADGLTDPVVRAVDDQNVYFAAGGHEVRAVRK